MRNSSKKRKNKKLKDAINPSHYKDHPSGVECIQITEHMPFLAGNAMKYLWRAGQKGDETQDLKKAMWYIQRRIDQIGANTNDG